MAESAARVTIIGNGQNYLATRAAILRHFWPITTVPLDVGAIPSLDTELVVVCQSLPDGERQDWVERVREQAPTMLVVKMNGYDSGPHASADATVAEEHGPAKLVSTIYELLTERGLESRAWPMDGAGHWLQSERLQ